MTLKHEMTLRSREASYNSAHERAVCLEMYYCADEDGVIRFTQQEIAERVQLSKLPVRKAVVNLVKSGLIRRTGRGRYRVTV
jgi:predicted transcriptional regulator of viral defense system